MSTASLPANPRPCTEVQREIWYDSSQNCNLAIYSLLQAINEMTLCPEIKIKTGDVMTFSIVYDVSKHPV
jgi:hypothetical protein